ncbi:MAG: hypothetical protein PHU85_16385, partial [Phycisphaerae bacterium]|nr:hypothetical protein [Phycisphaerae bacterium]
MRPILWSAAILTTLAVGLPFRDLIGDPNVRPVAAPAAPIAPTTQPTLKTKFGDVAIFPPGNPWNQDISKLPVHPQSADFVRSIGEGKSLHPDFGTVYNGAPNGIPYVAVPADQKKVPVTFEYADESDKGAAPAGAKPAPNVGWYPIPDDAPIEGGPKSSGDRHILVIDPIHKLLYETWSTYKTPTGYKAGSGAIFDLTSDGKKLRPEGWTSADAAGLPVFPGLVRYDEVAEGKAIRHAIRFTVVKTQRGYIHPATHFASRSKDAKLPPMGLRVRLRANFDDSKAPACAKVIIQAMKTYGL